jgi:2-iminoacetate synthase
MPPARALDDARPIVPFFFTYFDPDPYRTRAARPGARRAREPLEDPAPLLAPLWPGTPPPRPGDDLEERLSDWLATPLDALIDAHRAAIAAEHAARFDRRVLLFAPLYVTSACLNDCAYCGFRRSRPGARVKLAPDDVVHQALYLAEQGHRTLDLVSGEIPTERFVAECAEACARIRAETPIARIHLNLGALSGEQYALLRAAGASAYHLYQETYDPAIYLAVHRRGPKRDMATRLRAAERALDTGFGALGLGVLLGLAPLREELPRLVRHARLLAAAHPAARIGISLPRIQAAGQETGFAAAEAVGDDAFVKAFLFLRRELPDAHLTLTTREPQALRDLLLRLGTTKLSAGVCTAPGGYGQRMSEGRAQFAIRDERTLAEVAERVRAAGLVPVFE